MKLTIFFIYGFLFSVVFLISALLWHAQMQDVYFVCHQKGVIADFVPPFVQPGESGGFYIKPPHVVYVIWIVYLGCTVAIPAVCSWLILRMHRRALKKAWLL
ncbi:MAG TPA: hypothetical protein VG754_05330 [Verrucomicrobiae bacterium]|jgi:hypothetical protein|nr:hypothetical protein [Verrucomicrobiae bacterium]